LVKKVKGPKPKHIPQRTCVACRGAQSKRELVRIVRTGTGEVEVDLTGKRAGRGAYLCPNPTCWEQALKRRILEHALQTTISPENRAVLEEYSQGLAPVEPENPDE
jgi:predicted RNA-binding protein YlxR (DUF448 family)